MMEKAKTILEILSFFSGVIFQMISKKKGSHFKNDPLQTKIVIIKNYE